MMQIRSTERVRLHTLACMLALILAGVLANFAWPRVALAQATAQPVITEHAAKKNPQQPAAAAPYANMPLQAVPFQRFRKPYQEWYVAPSTLGYDGGARSAPDGNLAQLQAVNIGFLGPLDKENYDSTYGIPMLHGAQLAVEEANARGGDHGKPFALLVHDDLPLWGASSMALVDMRVREKDWAMFGSVDSASTHIELRATLKLELPIMDTATNDPTVTETRIPWLMHDFPDDRQQGYALADYIFNQRKLKKIGLLQVNNRYGREGDRIFFDTARRMKHQPDVVLKFKPTDTDFSSQLHTLNATGIDGLMIWGDAQQAGMILKQMRAMGMQQPVFGSSRVAHPEVMQIAGPAAEGLVVVTPLDPTRTDPKWQQFRQHYQARFHEEPDAYAAYAFDGMNILLGAIQKAGLNRGRIMDALRDYEMQSYAGVSGTAFFDYALNNIAPVTFAQVRQGKFVYWPELRTDWKKNNSIEKKQARNNPAPPYASIAEKGVSYAGPAREPAYNLSGSEIHLGLLAQLHGPQKAQGDAMVAAAQIALRDTARTSLRDGHRVTLVVGDESGPSWAHISDALLRLVLKEQAVAIITSAHGDVAHISEQMGNRLGVPILTLAADATTTQVNVPWIFRLGPSDAQQAQLMMQEIYSKRGFKNVLLVTEGDHDGRAGSQAFQQAARQLGDRAPDALVLNSLQPEVASLSARVQVKMPEAVLLWTQPETTDAVLQALETLQPRVPIYLSQQAVLDANVQTGTNSWTVSSDAKNTKIPEQFARRYRAITGADPSSAAAETYDAVCLLVRALRVAGSNRARVRDQLARVKNFSGASGTITFDNEGNNATRVHLVRLHPVRTEPQQNSVTISEVTP